MSYPGVFCIEMSEKRSSLADGGCPPGALGFARDAGGVSAASSAENGCARATPLVETQGGKTPISCSTCFETGARVCYIASVEPRMVRDQLYVYFPRLSAAERSREAILAIFSQYIREAHDTPKRCRVRPALCTAVSRSSVDLRRRSDRSGTCSAATARNGAQHWLRAKRFRLAPKRERFRTRWKKTTRTPTDVALLRKRRSPRHPRAARRGAHTRIGRVRSEDGAADRLARPGAENRQNGRRTTRRASQRPRGDRITSPLCLRNACAAGARSVEAPLQR